MPPGGKEWLFDAGLAALESIRPGKIYYGTLRCMSPSGELLKAATERISVISVKTFLSPIQCHTFFPHCQNFLLVLYIPFTSYLISTYKKL